MFVRRSILATLFALCLINTASAHSDGHKHGDGPILIEAAFARASASAVVKSGAAYLKIHNTGDAADRLIAAEGDAAAMIQLHTHIMQDGVMTMTEIAGGVEIPADGAAEFAPGGNHIMLMGLKAPLVEGEVLPLTLVFVKAGRIPVEIPILTVGAMGADKGHGTMSH